MCCTRIVCSKMCEESVPRLLRNVGQVSKNIVTKECQFQVYDNAKW